jgi:hypothetical protein
MALWLFRSSAPKNFNVFFQGNGNTKSWIMASFEKDQVGNYICVQARSDDNGSPAKQPAINQG